MHKKLQDFEIQSSHSILDRRLYLERTKKKKKCYIVDVVISEEKMKKIDK